MAQFPNVNNIKKRYDAAIINNFPDFPPANDFYRVNMYVGELQDDSGREYYVTVFQSYFLLKEEEKDVPAPELVHMVGVFRGPKLIYMIKNPSGEFFDALENEELDLTGEIIDDYSKDEDGVLDFIEE